MISHSALTKYLNYFKNNKFYAFDELISGSITFVDSTYTIAFNVSIIGKSIAVFLRTDGIFRGEIDFEDTEDSFPIEDFDKFFGKAVAIRETNFLKPLHDIIHISAILTEMRIYYSGKERSELTSEIKDFILAKKKFKFEKWVDDEYKAKYGEGYDSDEEDDEEDY